MYLTKHHGLGNDFLVALALDDEHPFASGPIDPAVAVAVCDRHRGIGADGLLCARRGADAPFTMELRNEDGSRAEMSGNGISCLAQAIVRAGHATDVVEIETDAGHRRVEVIETVSATEHRMRVAMGEPVIVGDAPDWIGPGVRSALMIDVGNPHLVLLVDGDAPDLQTIGERANAAIAGGTNVELIRVPARDRVQMSVYERGVGPTQACGTGAVAAATAAQQWGLVDATATVAQPGGDAVVDTSPGAEAPAHLTVPVVAVAELGWLRTDG